MTPPRPLAVTVLALVLAAGLGACGGTGKGKDTKVTIDTAGPGVKNDGTPVSLKASLKGTEEVPGPGVKDGTGTVVFDVTGTKGCYDLSATMGEKPTKAHIHQGAPGASGPVVVDLMPAFTAGESAFTAKSCVDLPGELAAKLIADPGAYYVNVHSEAHPDGAMRGQLAKV
ncbi:MAG TPA: CHRD domain-containing protein [Acidimicrobiia bacterium]|nr:CHRD domain-containing protein [Acidimicrobiia bacterium]